MRDSLVWLRERFVEYLKQNKAHPMRGRLLDQLVEIHRSLVVGKKEGVENAWDELQGVALQLELNLDKWLGSKLDLPEFLRNETKTQSLPEMPAVLRPDEVQSLPPSSPSAETFEVRREAILREFQQIERGLNKSRLSPEEKKACRAKIKEMERVLSFVEREWISLRKTGKVKGDWTADEIEKAQLGLMDRIFVLKRYLDAESAGEADALRVLWEFRDYQQRMISNFEGNVEDKIAPWLALASPMQTGKTSLIPHIIKVLRKHYGAGARCIVLCRNKIQADQIMRDLLEHFPQHLVGRYDSEVKDARDITVAMVGTMAGHLKSDPVFALDGRPVFLINDEAASTQSQTFQTIYTHFGLAETIKEGRHAVLKPKWGNGLVVGLSGTGAGLEGYHLSGQLDFLTAMQEGWIRHMEIDRVLLKISSQKQTGTGGEKMIWWEPTLENARALVEIYDKKIQGKHEKVLTYVPTTKHADLLAQAMEEKYGKGHSHVVHSKLSPDKIKQALDRYEKEGGNLISVGMLSRSYRGTGTGAVFHTYQSDSVELVAQRTGRAQGVSEEEVLPDLYVLEVAWSERDSFATMAKIAGLVEVPLRKISTREIAKVVPAIQRRKKLEEERDRRIEIGEVISIFKTVPLAEEWRSEFQARLEEAGGVEKMAAVSALSPALITGFALGALPTSLSDMMQLKDYFGGEEGARRLWLDSWKRVVDGVLGGRERGAGALDEALLAWGREQAEDTELARSLDSILRRYFPRRRKLLVKTPAPKQVSLPKHLSSLLSQLAEIVGEEKSESELMEIFRSEAGT
ncbi:MAG TPA: hypothetical protein DF383_07065, partial [Deltaproteobacteria bacterium]|nr:hypothetical protein [Deltaproteobacteria bacterium]